MLLGPDGDVNVETDILFCITNNKILMGLFSLH